MPSASLSLSKAACATGRLRLHATILIIDLTNLDAPSYLTTVHALMDPKLLVLLGGGDLGQRRCPPPHYYIGGDFAGKRYSIHDHPKS
jgi:hypothetical protein